MALSEKYLFLPEYWFFGIDTLFEFLFFLTTLLICWYGWKAYNMTKRPAPRDFFIGFSLISLSYLIKSITNFVLHFQIRGGNYSQLVTDESMRFLARGYYGHLLLFLSGLIFLSYMALKNPTKRTRWLIFALVMALSLQSYYKMTNFYISSFILLAAICYHYGKLWHKTGNRSNLIVFMGFLSLFIGQAVFFLIDQHILFYVTGHLLELGGYALLLMNLLMCMWFKKCD